MPSNASRLHQTTPVSSHDGYGKFVEWQDEHYYSRKIANSGNEPWSEERNQDSISLGSLQIPSRVPRNVTGLLKLVPDKSQNGSYDSASWKTERMRSYMDAPREQKLEIPFFEHHCSASKYQRSPAISDHKIPLDREGGKSATSSSRMKQFQNSSQEERRKIFYSRKISTKAYADEAADKMFHPKPSRIPPTYHRDGRPTKMKWECASDDDTSW